MRGAVQMQITTIGLDIAKNVFQVHGIDAKEKVVARKQLRRSQVITFFKALPPCLIVSVRYCNNGSSRMDNTRSWLSLVLGSGPRPSAKARSSTRRPRSWPGKA